jgi:hypothetical protein
MIDLDLARVELLQADLGQQDHASGQEMTTSNTGVAE